jgi:hypothetical protein
MGEVICAERNKGSRRIIYKAVFFKGIGFTGTIKVR